MSYTPTVSMGRLQRIIVSPSLWLVIAMLLSGVLLHYSAQLRTLPIPIRGEVTLARHATERVLLILPIGYAAFALGPTAGLVTLVAAFLIMVPRILFLSPSPADAAIETMAVTLVGGLTIWLAWIKKTQEVLREKATVRLQAINAVAAVLTGSLELRRMLGEALSVVLELTGIEAGLIFVLAEKEADLTLVAYRGLPRALIESATGLKLARMLVTDPALTSQVALPLKSKGQTLGALVVGESGSRRFLPEEVELLSAIASQMGVAAENARLHRDVTRQLERERRLNEVAEGITSELELDKVLSKVVQIAEELVGADAGVIGLLDEARGVIRYPYRHNLPDEMMQARIPEGEGLAAQVITSDAPAVIEDYPAYPRRLEAFVKGGLKSIMVVPIVTGGKVFGSLAVLTLRERRSFSDRDVTVLSGVARQAAIAIENAQLYENMRFYAKQILTAQEQERRRMARELHDDTAQSLVALSRQLDALLVNSEGETPPAVKARLENLRKLTAQIAQDVRRFSQDLRPSSLDDLGLLPTLEGLTSRMSEEDHIETRLEVVGAQRRLSPEVELVLFRIAQEALTNVRKHSGATQVVTTVEFCNGTVKITVQDNGRGFQPPGQAREFVEVGKLGLTGMVERAELAGGSLTVHSGPGQGTTVQAEIPV
ncbi:MAG TPA: GAF domain-containing sensor histidine kinase [Anaerolineae bacterium]|nr:GAF domain-containing sensor histidine kinase [Anaerolineae bacterium]